ncbi:retrovirus-related pol polyprotein from transposon TNT 1-94 [Tanacetum coccineum]
MWVRPWVEPVYVQNRVSVNEISSLKEGKLEWRKMVKCKYVRSGCTTALNVVPWETDGESVLREACPTRASFHDLLLLSSFIVYSVCLLLLPYSNLLNVIGAPIWLQIMTNIDSLKPRLSFFEADPIQVANHAEKPEKFNGQNFKRWQQKMFFHLGTLNLAWFLNETAPQLRMERLNLGNSPTANIKGKGDVIHIWKRSWFKPWHVGKSELATYLLNKIPRKEKEETPYELWMRRKPSYQYLRVWGCLAKVDVPTPKAQKIGPKSVDCIFIGYAKNSTAYRFIVHESKNPDIQKNTIMESRNASFFENIFPCLSKGTGSSSRLDDKVVQDKRQRDDNDLQDERQDQTDEEEVEPRRSKRARNEKSFGPDFVSFMVENEPTSYREAVTSSEGQQWREAIKSEIESILQNHTWELVDLPPGCKPLGYKWIFKKKMKADGTVDKYKARVVIQGFRQREGLDYFDTYSPVTRITSIRMIIAIAALRNLEIHQMDVKTAFLNGDLEEEIYMNQPEGFIAPGQEGKVCRLVKSLYGLKQAPKQWHQKFDHTMLESGFKINECDKCVYVKDTSAGYVILCLYVDDMLIVGSNDKIIRSTKDMLKSKFDMKDMGLADVILGIKIIRTQNGLVLSQAHYVDKILNTHNAGDSGQARTPIDTSLHLSKNRGLGVAQLEYSRIIGMLMYLMTGTRPDLAYAVSRLSRYTSNPSYAHWKAITRVLHYLRYSRDYGLHYDRHPAVIEGYSDANWISDIKDSRSTSGYVFTLGGAAISWKSSKQTVIAKSTMESEFIALDKCGEEAEWLRQFVEDIPRWPKPVTAISIHCDSKSAMGRAKSTMYNGKSRHIRRRHNSIRQLLSTGVISIDYVASKDNIADPFTKGLSRELVRRRESVDESVLSSPITDELSSRTSRHSDLEAKCISPKGRESKGHTLLSYAGLNRRNFPPKFRVFSTDFHSCGDC